MAPVIHYLPVDLVWDLRESYEPQEPLLRHCFRCGESKGDREFHNSRTGQFSYCSECRRAYDRRYYVERGRDARLERGRVRRAAARDWLDSLRRGVPCTDCGESFPGPVMHWDHLPGQAKLDAVSNVARERSRQVALVEMQKCELVCANCHAVRTSKRGRSKRGN